TSSYQADVSTVAAVAGVDHTTALAPPTIIAIAPAATARSNHPRRRDHRVVDGDLSKVDMSPPMSGRGMVRQGAAEWRRADVFGHVSVNKRPHALCARLAPGPA